MQILRVYPTSRAIRLANERYAGQGDGFIPAMMRMDEFEKRVVLVPDSSEIDRLQRVLFLREAARFEGFDAIGSRRLLSRFFTQSQDFFKFFEELAGEGVGIGELVDADTYAEYADHLDILATLLARYKAIVKAKGLYDKSFLPEVAVFNDAFIKRFDRVEIVLEGYLTRFEWELLEKVAAATELIVEYTTTHFSDRMIRQFEAFGLSLRHEAYHRINLTHRRIEACTPISNDANVRVFSVRERSEQAAVVFAMIDEMVQRGLRPDRIAVVTPDERFARLLRRFDRLRNLNFAMGTDVSEQAYYKRLREVYRSLLAGEAVDQVWQTTSDTALPEFWQAVDATVEMGEADTERLRTLQESFHALFAQERMRLSEWLFLWLERLRDLRIDDVGGGLVTVMGVLETRSVDFDGVIIVDFNEGKVPVRSGKDRFLNSSVRAHAGLPTRSDREALQKHYYRRILQQSKEAVLLFSQGEDALPSRFLYELGLSEFTPVEAPLEALYAPHVLSQPDDPIFVPDAMHVTWSASRLKTWLVCKRQYYYRYVKGLQEQSDDFNEGAFIHRVLEETFEEGEYIEDEAALRRRLHRVLDLRCENDMTGRYRNALYKRRLEPFIAYQCDRYAKGWHIMRKEVPIEGTIGDLRFTGRIDRIDRSDQGYCIIDYKTGYVEPMRKVFNAEKTTDFQMPIYVLLSGVELDRVQTLYLKVFEGEEIGVTHMDERIEALYRHLRELKQVNRVQASKCDDTTQCRHCAYRLICERGEYL